MAQNFRELRRVGDVHLVQGYGARGNMSCCPGRRMPRRAHPNQVWYYEASLYGPGKPGPGSDLPARKHILLVGSRGGVRTPVAWGWSYREARERLAALMRGKKVIDANTGKTLARIPRTFA